MSGFPPPLPLGAPSTGARCLTRTDGCGAVLVLLMELGTPTSPSATSVARCVFNESRGIRVFRSPCRPRYPETVPSKHSGGHLHRDSVLRRHDGPCQAPQTLAPAPARRRDAHRAFGGLLLCRGDVPPVTEQDTDVGALWLPGAF